MIHNGNSGGPIVDANSLAVVGLVTMRRFLGDAERNAILKEMNDLQTYLDSVRGQGSVTLMGVNFTEFASSMSRVASVTSELIRLNSTTGIGLGLPIQHVHDRCKAEGLF
jgi:hypothetical protein